MIEYLGLWALIALSFNMWALISVAGASVALWKKAIWALVLLIPGLGFIIWYLLGPRAQIA
ncbi:hypothetical protein N9L47_03910 [Rhodobacteraceae bacterium]|nr:hypothetical protein [Paracoccaceae bacterium]